MVEEEAVMDEHCEEADTEQGTVKAVMNEDAGEPIVLPLGEPALTQAVSVTLSGVTSEDPLGYAGSWNYVGANAVDTLGRPLAFEYKRARAVAPIPAWQLAMMRGVPSEDILELWDPVTVPSLPVTSAAAGAASGTVAGESAPQTTVLMLPAAPYVAPHELAPDPAHHWSGSWEGFFMLRKNGRDSEVRERFYLEPSRAAQSAPNLDSESASSAGDAAPEKGEGQLLRVAGGGTNAYGRFQLTGTFESGAAGGGRLTLDRAYTNMPRKRRKRLPPAAATATSLEGGSDQAQALKTPRRAEAATTLVGEDGQVIEVPATRRRRAPTKFDESQAEEEYYSRRMKNNGSNEQGENWPAGKVDPRAADASAQKESASSGDSEFREYECQSDGADHENEELFDDDESVVEEVSDEELDDQADDDEGDDDRRDEENGRVEWRESFMDEEANEVYEGGVLVKEDGTVLRSGFGLCVYLSTSNAGGLAQGSSQGSSTTTTTQMYEGQWSQNKEHGNGTLTLGGGSRKEVVYSGEWVDGKMSGVGKYVFANSGGAEYEGDFRENARHGRGVYTLPSGAKYDGEWSNNLRHGRGSFEWADGKSSYEGHWCEDRRHGSGRLELANGLCYDGNWSRGDFDGRGVCTYPDGQRYEGSFKSGKKDGRGSLTFPNGASYEGRFRDDKIDGQGTLLIPAPVPCSGDSAGEHDIADEWVIPVSFQSDMGRIHAKAGFDKAGM